MTTETIKGSAGIGELLPRDVLLLRKFVGTASGGDGPGYEMSTTMALAPMVKSNKTGKTFHLSWRDLIELAVANGVDDE